MQSLPLRTYYDYFPYHNRVDNVDVIYRKFVTKCLLYTIGGWLVTTFLWFIIVLHKVIGKDAWENYDLYLVFEFIFILVYLPYLFYLLLITYRHIYPWQYIVSIFVIVVPSVYSVAAGLGYAFHHGSETSLSWFVDSSKHPCTFVTCDSLTTYHFISYSASPALTVFGSITLLEIFNYFGVWYQYIPCKSLRRYYIQINENLMRNNKLLRDDIEITLLKPNRLNVIDSNNEKKEDKLLENEVRTHSPIFSIHVSPALSPSCHNSDEDENEDNSNDNKNNNSNNSLNHMGGSVVTSTSKSSTIQTMSTSHDILKENEMEDSHTQTNKLLNISNSTHENIDKTHLLSSNLGIVTRDNSAHSQVSQASQVSQVSQVSQISQASQVSQVSTTIDVYTEPLFIFKTNKVGYNNLESSKCNCCCCCNVRINKKTLKYNSIKLSLYLVVSFLPNFLLLFWIYTVYSLFKNTDNHIEWVIFYFVMCILSSIFKLTLKYIGRNVDYSRIKLVHLLQDKFPNRRSITNRYDMSFEIIMQIFVSCFYWFLFRRFIMLNFASMIYHDDSINVIFQILLFAAIILFHLLWEFYVSFVQMTQWFYHSILFKSEMFYENYFKWRIFENIFDANITYEQWQNRCAIDLVVRSLVMFFSAIIAFATLFSYWIFGMLESDLGLTEMEGIYAAIIGGITFILEMGLYWMSRWYFLHQTRYDVLAPFAKIYTNQHYSNDLLFIMVSCFVFLALVFAI